jgi:penicillin-binding protein A
MIMQVNKRIIYLLIILSSMFFILVAYLTYFQLFVGDNIISSSYNRRQMEKENNTIRGNIYDRSGTILAKNEIKDGKSERIYPFGSLYCHVIGYNSKSYGRTLIESRFNDYLLGNKGIGAFLNFNVNTSASKSGDNLYLSIDHNLQKLAQGQLKGRDGAIVVMNSQTGEILAMVSKPDFNPNSESLSNNWQTLVESKEYPFYSRAVQGLYAPGSTFKIVTAAAAVEKGLDGLKINDEGSILVDGKVINNFDQKAYGNIDIKRAMAVSSNVFFAQLGLNLGFDSIKNIVGSFGLGKEIPFDLPVNESVFPYKSMTQADMAAAGIGQGKLLVTPLQMAMITSCIANKGVMMKPRLVTKAVAPDGNAVKEWKPEVLYHSISSAAAIKVGEMMREAVVSGTGSKAAVKGVHIAGKTGTAENELTGKEKNREHAWFTCYAPFEDPKIVVTVILEYSGSTGGKAAAPIAGKLIQAALAEKD